MGQPGRLKACHPIKLEANVGNRTILVPIGRENNNDSPSSGERTGKSPNHTCYGMYGVVGPRDRKTHDEWKNLESFPIDGDRPVHEVMRSVAAP